MLKNTYDKKLAQNRESLKNFVENEYEKLINCTDSSNLTGAEKTALSEEIFKQKDKPACFAYIIKYIASLCVQEYRSLYTNSLSSGNVSEYKLFLSSTCFDDETVEYLQNMDKFNLHRIKLYIDAKSKELVETLSASNPLENTKLEALKNTLLNTKDETINQSIIVSYIARKMRSENPKYYRLLQTIHTDGNGNNIDSPEQKLSSIYPDLKISVVSQHSTRHTEAMRNKYVEAFRNAYYFFLKNEDDVKNAISTLNANNIPITDETIQLQLKYNFGKTRAYNAVYNSPYCSSSEILEIKSQVEKARQDLKLFYSDISNQLNQYANDPKNIEIAKSWFKTNFDIENPSQTQITTVVLANSAPVYTQNQNLASVLRSFKKALSVNNAYTDQIILSTFKALGTPLKNSELKEVKETADLVNKASIQSKKLKALALLSIQKDNVISKIEKYLKDENFRNLAMNELNENLKKNPKSKTKISDTAITNQLLSRLRTYNQTLYVTISNLNLENLGTGHVSAKLEKLGFSAVKNPTRQEIIVAEYKKALTDNNARKELIQKAYNAGFDVDLKLENSSLAYLNNKAMATYMLNERTNEFYTFENFADTAKDLDVYDYYETLTQNLKKSMRLNSQLIKLFLSLNSKIRLSNDGEILNPESIDMLTYLSPIQLKKYKLKSNHTIQDLSSSRKFTTKEISAITRTGVIGGNNHDFAGYNDLTNLSRFFDKNLDYTIAVVLKRNRDFSSKTEFRRFSRERLTKSDIDNLNRIVEEKFNKYINSSEFKGENSKSCTYADHYKAILKYLEICKDVLNENINLNQSEQ